MYGIPQIGKGVHSQDALCTHLKLLEDSTGQVSREVWATVTC